MSEGAEGARTLEQHLARVAGEASIDGLEPGFHGAVRPVAAKMLSANRSLAPSALRSLESSPEMAAATAAVHLRALDVLEFWKPLLKHAFTGSSPAPIPDLKSTSEAARALMDVLNERPSSEMRDKVLRMATEAAASVEKWIPDGRRTGTGTKGPKVSRYQRGAFHESEDEEGNPVERAPTARRVKRERPESAAKRVFGWILTIALVAAMGVGAIWFILQQLEPEPVLVDVYSALVSDVQDKSVDGTELVLVMTGSWVQKKSMHRESDLRLLGTTSGREKIQKVDSVRMETAAGTLLGRLDADGNITWGAPAIAADELRAEQDRAMEELDAMRRGDVKVGDGGELARPLSADELGKVGDKD